MSKGTEQAYVTTMGATAQGWMLSAMIVSIIVAALISTLVGRGMLKKSVWLYERIDLKNKQWKAGVQQAGLPHFSVPAGGGKPCGFYDDVGHRRDSADGHDHFACAAVRCAGFFIEAWDSISCTACLRWCISATPDFSILYWVSDLLEKSFPVPFWEGHWSRAQESVNLFPA